MKKGQKKDNYPPGSTKTRAYISWCAMKARCASKNPYIRSCYSDRGISYDPSWERFSGFFRDMGECPENLTLDRIDNDLGYSKENCRWASRGQQTANKRAYCSTGHKYIYDSKHGTFSVRIGKYSRNAKTLEEAKLLRDKHLETIKG